MEIVNTLGRRKTAVARIYLSEGKGNITVNKREFKEYFPSLTLQYIVMQPLNLVGVPENYDIKVNLGGGGATGQAEALRLAVTRALMEINPEWRTQLKAAGFVTRDPREVERKKPGQPKARKKTQFSKR